VYRYKDTQGRYVKDVIALADEKLNEEPLLIQVMENGKLTYELPTLNEVRSEAKENLFKLPEQYKKLTNPQAYPVELSKMLEDLRNTLTQKLTNHEKMDAGGKT
jgi:nicotinate phosphoribosyltransferase